MLTLMVIGICYTLYGIAGLFGFQIIPEQYKGHPWTKDYIRSQGIGYLLIGVPWLVISMLADIYFASVPLGIMIAVVAVPAIPALLYAFACDKKYKAMLKKETDETET